MKDQDILVGKKKNETRAHEGSPTRSQETWVVKKQDARWVTVLSAPARFPCIGLEGLDTGVA